jgi:hypothetical protein
MSRSKNSCSDTVQYYEARCVLANLNWVLVSLEGSRMMGRDDLYDYGSEPQSKFTIVW